jgi:hypothetical protein
MKKVSRLLACSMALMITLSLPSYGWNKLGYMAVAFVAYQNLSQPVRDRIDVLLRINKEYPVWESEMPAGASADDKKMMAFMIAATWPDRLRSSTLHPEIEDDGSRQPDLKKASRNTGYDDILMHRYWHFIDKPFSPDGSPTEDPPEVNAKTRIALFRTVLASIPSNETEDLKSYDLVWLLHLVGDVHQPLHCTSRFTKLKSHGDNGGNGVLICDSPACKGNLHSFWDDALGNSPKVEAAIKVGNRLPKANAPAAKNLDVDKLVDDSFEDAKKTAYMNPPIGVSAKALKITQKYQDAVGSLCEKRVALAGARLANILNKELK